MIIQVRMYDFDINDLVYCDRNIFMFMNRLFSS